MFGQDETISQSCQQASEAHKIGLSNLDGCDEAKAFALAASEAWKHAALFVSESNVDRSLATVVAELGFATERAIASLERRLGTVESQSQ
ncbi:hypothetical protein [Corynebacterium pseudopelargi]|uniref:Uncharacterized protein n=1 Tax=Corynebacterium pseudopelargi TaxID=2080757 RepID=A0A3G6IVQ2_9CORY|nr:hypothetical protein [Corynebacterium pseudopelargi]AZA08738.1 hypothetical protein CPPEL_03035 [Corynebacterium pseudopelargi]